MAFQWVSDTYHFMRSMIDSSYVAPVYRAPLSSDPETRKRQGMEAQRFNDSTQQIAMNTETAMLTGGAYASNLLLPGAGPALVEIGTTLGLQLQGEAPPASAWNRFVPHQIPIIGGESHYQQKGGHPGNHPERLDRQQSPTDSPPSAASPGIADSSEIPASDAALPQAPNNPAPPARQPQQSWLQAAWQGTVEFIANAFGTVVEAIQGLFPPSSPATSAVETNTQPAAAVAANANEPVTVTSGLPHLTVTSVRER